MISAIETRLVSAVTIRAFRAASVPRASRSSPGGTRRKIAATGRRRKLRATTVASRTVAPKSRSTATASRTVREREAWGAWAEGVSWVTVRAARRRFGARSLLGGVERFDRGDPASRRSRLVTHVDDEDAAARVREQRE